jgi:transcriptional regulator with XRE-family HTH domain
MSTISNKSPDPLDVALGVAIRVRRRMINMSQEQLAERCGVTFQQVQKYENGINRTSFSRLVQIARALGCRVADLVEAIDASESGPDGSVNFLGRLQMAGSVEMLDLFERLSPAARSALIQFVRNGMLPAFALDRAPIDRAPLDMGPVDMGPVDMGPVALENATAQE